MAHRNRTRAARRRAERTRLSSETIERNTEAAEIAELVRRGVRTKPILEEYRNRGQIGEDRFRAGMKLRRDWYGVGKSLSPGRVQAHSWERFLDGGRYDDFTPYQLDCKARVDAALTAAGAPLASVLINVCFHDLPASDWALAFGRRPKSDGIACLRLGLDSLHAHYESRQGWWKQRITLGRCRS
jgi:hypothetical protein